MENSRLPPRGSMTPEPRTPEALLVSSVRGGTWLLSQHAAARSPVG